MKLTDEQKDALIKKLNSFWKEIPICIVCKNNVWTIADMVFELREFHGGTLVLGGGGKIYPVVTMMCERCGYTMFFNALSLGLYKPEEKEKVQIKEDLK